MTVLSRYVPALHSTEIFVLVLNQKHVIYSWIMIYVWRINHSDFTFYSCYVIADFLVKNKQTNKLQNKGMFNTLTTLSFVRVRFLSRITYCTGSSTGSRTETSLPTNFTRGHAS